MVFQVRYKTMYKMSRGQKVREDIHCKLICLDIDGTLLNDAKEGLPGGKQL